MQGSFPQLVLFVEIKSQIWEGSLRKSNKSKNMVKKFPQHIFSKNVESGVGQKRDKGSMQTQRVAVGLPIGNSYLKLGTAIFEKN